MPARLRAEPRRADQHFQRRAALVPLRTEVRLVPQRELKHLVQQVAVILTAAHVLVHRLAAARVVEQTGAPCGAADENALQCRAEWTT